MVIIQSKSKRKPTGGRYKAKIIKKRQHLVGRLPAMTKVAPARIQQIRARGNTRKLRALSLEKANVYDPSTKTFSIEKIVTVVDTPANKNFMRRRIMTKGTLIETAKGKAKVTSRPGQDGMICAILVK